MKKRIIGATLITVGCALLISNLVGVLLLRSRERDAARNTLQELLVLMDAQSAITDPDGLAQQFHAAAPDKRLTIIDTDGTVLADTEANPQTLEDHNSRPEVEQAAGQISAILAANNRSAPSQPVAAALERARRRQEDKP